MGLTIWSNLKSQVHICRLAEPRYPHSLLFTLHLARLCYLHFAFLIFTFALSNHLLRPGQHIGRDRHADLLGGN